MLARMEGRYAHLHDPMDIERHPPSKPGIRKWKHVDWKVLAEACGKQVDHWPFPD